MYDLDDVAAEEDALDDLPDFMKPDEAEPSDDDAPQAADTADVPDEPDDEPDNEHDDDK